MFGYIKMDTIVHYLNLGEKEKAMEEVKMIFPHMKKPELKVQLAEYKN
jgi:vacuolar-type H+-ATPase catalytic subunit A/Vma1